MSPISVLGGRVLDPAGGVDRVTDLHLAGGRVLALGEPPPGFVPERRIQARGRYVLPGLVDLRARLREPGLEHKATVASELSAAAASGITTLCMPPDTDPVVDTPAVAELIHQRAAAAGLARVEVLGALTRGLEGRQLAEMGALGAAGCRGLSNGDRAVADTALLRHALEYAASFDLTVSLHAEDPWLARGGYAHEGAVATRLGIPGVPEAAETITLARDLLLAEHTGARVHFCHLSSGRAVEMVGEARARDLPVSADVAVHQLYLTEMDVGDFDARCHVRPPLRTQRDREALRAGLVGGVVTVIASDHQPHEADAKLAPYASTEPGISALETLLPLSLRLVEEGAVDLSTVLAGLTCNPARLLGLEAGTLAPDAPADVCIVDPARTRVVRPEGLRSRGHNTPFAGWELPGRVTHTLLGGRLVFELDADGD